MSYNVVEKSLSELRHDLAAGVVTSVELVARYLDRIAFYDRHGITLNAVPILSPSMFAEARAADERRARGEVLSPLDGIPYTAKNSYKVKGLTVASGSPAFADLVATDDAFTIAQLRKAGAILIGLTNMPPMANGGMQRGLYGRAESPYNADFLTAAFGSGSSNGSGTATGASFAAFGLGEETWSSGRAPASNNGLCAYTPSRGVISTRGNWPLVPTMDVVVPHTRTMDDMLELLDLIVDDDWEVRGDFWRMQPWVPTPKSSELRPDSYVGLENPEALRGKRIAIPRMYINKDPETIELEEIDRIHTRDSVVELWNKAKADLEALGAEVIETDFPVVTNYESRGPGATNLVARGLVPETFAEHELWELSMWGWHDFLAANNDPHLNALEQVDGDKIFPVPTGSVPGRYDDHLHRFAPEDVPLEEYVVRAKRDGIPALEDIPDMAEGIPGLEKARKLDLEDWMDELGLDAVVFPAVADVGPADADVNEVSADLAWRNGTWVANGNLVPRHLGIPTVTAPLGVMADIGMPVGLTFAGRGYDDSNLLAFAWAFDHQRNRRIAAPRTPELGEASWNATGNTGEGTPTLAVSATAGEVTGGVVPIRVVINTTAAEVAITINGVALSGVLTDEGYVVETTVSEIEHTRLHSEWRGGYGSLIVVLARTGHDVVGDYVVVGGVA
ncbi:amidase [Aurantimicrobium minutum]|uniref:Amidase n=1 Tax=Aurantimicrobium minutum TaxID=708131 RepID=A0A173LXS8_9MICO|nr:amidase [Aurantimicrobium minutum]